jgi:hypothetical protein
MLKKTCPYHRGPTNHTLEECTMMRRYFSRGGQPKDDAEKKALDAQEGDDKDDGFPEVKNYFMIFGGRLVQLTTRQRKRERREVYAADPATPCFLDWSKEAIMFAQEDHPGHVLNLRYYPLVVDPVIGDTRLTKVLMDGATALTFCTPRFSTSWGSVGLGCEPTLRHSMGLCQGNVPPLLDRSISFQFQVGDPHLRGCWVRRDLPRHLGVTMLCQVHGHPQLHLP